MAVTRLNGIGNLSGARIARITEQWIALCVKKETAYFIRQIIGTALTVNANDDLTKWMVMKWIYRNGLK
jgi:hypothetical protein